jgi:hypothetical protein
MLGCIFDVLTNHACLVRLIQLRNPEEAPEVFKHYKIDGCVWYQPHPQLFLKISKLMENCKIPMVVPLVTVSPADAAKLPQNHFAIDFSGIGRVRAEYLIKRGHRNVVYCGDRESGTYDAFVAALEKGGITQNPDWYISKTEEIPERLPGILDSGEVTAIISDGGPARIESVFRVLDGHPWGRKGNLLVDSIGEELEALRKKYPRVNLTAVNFSPHHEIAIGAAEALVDAVKNGKTIQSAKFVSQVKASE